MESVENATRSISAARKTLIQGKRTQTPHQGIKHLGWESLLPDLPEGRGSVHASAA